MPKLVSVSASLAMATALTRRAVLKRAVRTNMAVSLAMATPQWRLASAYGKAADEGSRRLALSCGDDRRTHSRAAPGRPPGRRQQTTRPGRASQPPGRLGR